VKTERRVVTNRVFLLGLDELYREAMKKHEQDELLRAAQETAYALSVPPSDVPIEGYYWEDPRLTEYFRLMRALQQVPKVRESQVSNHTGFLLLKKLTESGIFGSPSDDEWLLRMGKDALSCVLEETFPNWSIEILRDRAYARAVESSDFSLVSLGALSKDSVVLAALRETMVLYGLPLKGLSIPPPPKYIWKVDPLVQSRSQQFVRTFNELLDESLPLPNPENAEQFWKACKEWKILGRCVRLGFDPMSTPTRHYHWLIERDSNSNLQVREFWDTEIWTTERCRKSRNRA